MKNKKAEMGTVAILLLIVVVGFIVWLINVRQRECSTNRECPVDNYCGSDFSCHEYPTIQRTYVQYDLTGPAIILAFAIIVTAILLNKDKLFRRREDEQMTEKHEHHEHEQAEKKHVEEKHEPSDEYYRSLKNMQLPHEQTEENRDEYYKRQTKKDAKGQSKHDYYDDAHAH